jgi:glyoxylase-like metal-dependent hydrolase (beta-lactamase superfamily II)
MLSEGVSVFSPYSKRGALHNFFTRRFPKNMMIIGPYSIHAIETGRFALDGGAMFGVVPKNLWTKAYHPGDEQNRIPMAARLLLVRSGDRVILVDTGNGTKLSEKLQSIYAIDTSIWSLQSSLAELGVTANDITDVVLTHLHFDHVGGATVMDGTTAIPAFPNARYYVQKKHFDWAMNPSEKDRASFMRENYVPLVDAGVLEFTDGDTELFPGFGLQCFHGHTPFLQMVKIYDDATTLIFPADLMPTHAHVPIAYGMGYDNFPLTTIEEKKAVLPQAAEGKWIVVFEHDALVPAGLVARNDKGFYFEREIIL